jgi:hypothetical protein
VSVRDNPSGTCLTFPCATRSTDWWNNAYNLAIQNYSRLYTQYYVNEVFPASAQTITGAKTFGPAGPIFGGVVTASLPTCNAAANGMVQRVTDGIRGLWKCNGTAWGSLTGYADVRDFGAIGDGVTDNGSAFTAAIAAAYLTENSARGIDVFVGKGTWITNSQIVIKNNVRLVGLGTRATIIKAGSSFPTSTALVRMGDGTGGVFDTRITAMQLDLNGVSGSIGVYSTETNEHSGLHNVLIYNYRGKGIHVSNAQAVFECNNVEFQTLSPVGAGPAIQYDVASGLLVLNHVVATGAGTPTHQIEMIKGRLVARGVHVENTTNGIYFDSAAEASGSVDGLTGHSSVTNLVNVGGTNAGVTLQNLYLNGATAYVVDGVVGGTVSPAVSNDGGGLALYVIGGLNGTGVPRYWVNGKTGDTNIRRVRATIGTALVAGDIALSAGWGSTASVSAISGTDQRFRFTVTSAGTGQAANPTATLTFKDGTWTTAPYAVCSRNGGNQPAVLPTWTTTATTLVLTFPGTPVAAETYKEECVVMG